MHFNDYFMRPPPEPLPRRHHHQRHDKVKVVKTPKKREKVITKSNAAFEDAVKAKRNAYQMNETKRITSKTYICIRI